MEACHLAVLEATESYNASGEIPEIYFAAGYALSSEFPFIPRSPGIPFPLPPAEP